MLLWYSLDLLVNSFIIWVLHSNQNFSMSKKKKHKHKNKQNHNQQNASSQVAAQSQTEEKNPATLDQQLEQLELQSMKGSGTDQADVVTTHTDSVTPAEKAAAVEVSDATEVAQEPSTNRVMVFVAGVVIGAIVTAIFI